MNNNYNTLIEGKPNLLNEVAANSNLLHPQHMPNMASFPGTAIRSPILHRELRYS